MSESDLDKYLDENPDLVAGIEVVTTTDEEELPPDPGLLVRRNAYGPGTHSVKFPDGTSFGVWMREQRLTPEEVREVLTEAGLEADLIDYFVGMRAKGIAADHELGAHPAVSAAAAQEADRDRAMESVRAAFLKARKG
jgi:hypothetical protein